MRMNSTTLIQPDRFDSPNFNSPGHEVIRFGTRTSKNRDEKEQSQHLEAGLLFREMNSVVFKRTFRLSGVLIIQTGNVAIN